MLSKLSALLEVIKTPTAAVIALVILLTVFLMSTVTQTQNEVLNQLLQHRTATQDMQRQVAQHNDEVHQTIVKLAEELQKYNAGRVAADERQALYLRGICYYTATGEAQKNWCLGIK